MPCLRKITKK